MTKLYNKDGVIDRIEDYINNNLVDVIEDNRQAIIKQLELEGYKITKPLKINEDGDKE